MDLDQNDNNTNVKTNSNVKSTVNIIIDYINSIITYLIPDSLKNTCCSNFIYFVCWLILIVSSLLIAYFILVGLALFFTYIITVREYNIHTGCLYNDTFVKNDPYTYSYCFDNSTNTRYNILYCSVYDNRNIFAGCFMFGIVGAVCIGSMIFYVVMIYIIYRNCKNRKALNDEHVDNITNQVTIITDNPMKIITDNEHIKLDRLYNISINDETNKSNNNDSIISLDVDGSATSYEQLSE